MGVCWTVRQSTVVMAMTASGLAALGLSHIRHSVKLLFAKAMRWAKGSGGGGLGHGSRVKGKGAGRWWGSRPLQTRTHPSQVSR